MQEPHAKMTKPEKDHRTQLIVGSTGNTENAIVPNVPTIMSTSTQTWETDWNLMEEKVETDLNPTGETVAIAQSPKAVNAEIDHNHVIEDDSGRIREDANAHNQEKDSAREAHPEEAIGQEDDQIPEKGTGREVILETKVAVSHETEEVREIGGAIQGKDLIMATR